VRVSEEAGASILQSNSRTPSPPTVNLSQLLEDAATSPDCTEALPVEESAAVGAQDAPPPVVKLSIPTSTAAAMLAVRHGGRTELAVVTIPETGVSEEGPLTHIGFPGTYSPAYSSVRNEPSEPEVELATVKLKVCRPRSYSPWRSDRSRERK
jgi:hypothetical protein